MTGRLRLLIGAWWAGRGARCVRTGLVGSAGDRRDAGFEILLAGTRVGLTVVMPGTRVGFAVLMPGTRVGGFAVLVAWTGDGVASLLGCRAGVALPPQPAVPRSAAARHRATPGLSRAFT